MKCNECRRIGLSGGRKCCGVLLSIGETVYIREGKINETCPLEKDSATQRENTEK